MSDLLGTIVRGIRARALLSAGCVLLAALAVASAVLGPVFQVAVTRSYVVTRINEAPPSTTGLMRTFSPTEAFAGGTDDAVRAARAYAAGHDRGPFQAVRTTLETRPVEGGLVERDSRRPGTSTVLAKDGACRHVIIDQGRCPNAPGETIVLRGDADHTRTPLGARLDMGPDIPALTVVGTYLVDPSQEEYWFDLERLASHPRRLQPADFGVSQPYRPAPYLVTPGSFDAIPPTAWKVLFDRRIHVAPDWTDTQIRDARRSGDAVANLDEVVDGGRITGDPTGNVTRFVAEARSQERTARASIAPAVLSLVLVALALLMRLLMAAAELRTPELALASLRGVSERRLWGLGLVEPLALLAVGLPVGILLGFGLSVGVMRAWLVPGLPVPLPLLLLGTVGVVVLAAVGVSVAAVAAVLTGSLSSQLTGVRRPTASRRVAIIAELVLVAVAVAVLVSKLSVARPGNPDLTDMVLPIVLAVVAGLVTTRVIALVARWRARKPGRTLPGFVAARALGRRAEGTLVILPLTAAIAVGVFAIGVYDAAAQWRHSVAVTASPGHTLWRAPGTMSQTMTATHDIDPAGDHLMALAELSVPGTRLSVVDGPRLSSVAEWPDSWTPGVPVTQVQHDLASRGEPIELTGATMGVRYDNAVVHEQNDLVLNAHLFTAAGAEKNVYLGPLRDGSATTTIPVPFCRGGCTLGWMTLAGPAALQTAMKGTITVHDLLADGKPVRGAFTTGAAWVQSGGLGDTADVGDVRSTGDGLVADVDTGSGQGMLRMVPGGIAPARPVLVGVDSADRVAPQEGGGYGMPLTGAILPVDPVLRGASMPFLGPDGVMIDYRQLVADRLIFNQTFDAFVAADASTPSTMRRALQERGYTVATTVAAQERTLGQGAYALALRLYSLVAVLVLLMALAGLVVSTAVQLPPRRRDAAALRVVGVPRRAVMSAVARELGAVLAGAAVAGIAAGALAQYVVVRTVRLGYVESLATPALVARVDWGWIGALVLGAALVLGGFALASALLTVRGARGATLRESAR